VATGVLSDTNFTYTVKLDHPENLFGGRVLVISHMQAEL